MKRIVDALYRVLQIAITLLMGLLIVPVTMQILSRYTELIPSYIWTEEVARFCFIWIVMLGAMIAVRDGSHFELDVLPHPETAAGKGWARLIVDVAIALVALIFVGYGFPFTSFGADQHSELTGISMVTIHIAWPLAGLVWLIFLAERLHADIRLIQGHADDAR
ncbi:MAG: TRAP transporter small permease [Alphaproteobacteria bacterium]